MCSCYLSSCSIHYTLSGKHRSIGYNLGCPSCLRTHTCLRLDRRCRHTKHSRRRKVRCSPHRCSSRVRCSLSSQIHPSFGRRRTHRSRFGGRACYISSTRMRMVRSRIRHNGCGSRRSRQSSLRTSPVVVASTCSAFVSVCVYYTVVTSSSAWDKAACASA